MQLHPRFAGPRLVEALSDTPVVLIHGPRQCGKTTLARTIDDVALAAAEADPAGFVADLPERAILDEVQRVPGLFPALKSVVLDDEKIGEIPAAGTMSVYVPLGVHRLTVIKPGLDPWVRELSYTESSSSKDSLEIDASSP